MEKFHTCSVYVMCGEIIIMTHTISVVSHVKALDYEISHDVKLRECRAGDGIITRCVTKCVIKCV